MSEHKHTPGPWVAVADEILTEKTRHQMPDRGYREDPDDVHNIAIARLSTWQDDIAAGEHRANALLIAAAPGLLEALEAYDAFEGALLMDEKSWNTPTSHPFRTDHLFDKFMDCQGLRRAAIAKARGE